MADDLTGNPWLIDSTGVKTTAKVRLHKLRWVGATTAGHTVVVKDNNSNTIWASEAAGANHVEAERLEVEVDGINVTAIGSGTLYITRAQRPTNNW